MRNLGAARRFLMSLRVSSIVPAHRHDGSGGEPAYKCRLKLQLHASLSRYSKFGRHRQRCMCSAPRRSAMPTAAVTAPLSWRRRHWRPCRGWRRWCHAPDCTLGASLAFSHTTPKLRALVVPKDPGRPAQAAPASECEAACAHYRPVRLSWAKLLKCVLAATQLEYKSVCAEASLSRSTWRIARIAAPS